MEPNTSPESTVSVLAEIPEELHESLKEFLETRLDWDQDRVFMCALSLFLLQHPNPELSGTEPGKKSFRRAARVYLDSLFNKRRAA